MASRCAACQACANICPTGAITEHSFLVDNEKCLSYLNESGNPFPEWLPESVHHCVYDCLKCQLVCPMNMEQVKQVAAPVQFSESETELLLSDAGFREYPASLQKKAFYLGLHQWPDGLARNIRVLIESAGHG
ncbi:MAG: 4Fe-4S binding protein [Spirochaetales bacterium]|nr:4Fe-4S binding protein [Spirochaetales bacterium]